ncbi:hypothetical protein C1752_01598 [Acaryochloris thomasi RCC1774]|uniref:Guanylate cyclase domain-containing protein n=1 Tax=Acaryochloris thomasi RCC1774 TaxID=1764569 RepID=A0A2W1JTA4_9CYAN|nr:hypothetical protein [Acaryochloris thomasi]PZD73812.1 hypothetical protein C1752_01598 [Acaryochloris thomasi RCC1774]
MTLPSPLAQHICDYIAEQYLPAYLRVDANGTILELGGQLEHYELQTLQRGDTAHNSLDVLTGLIPLENDPIFLPLVKDQQGRSMDIHIVPATDSDWILLLDGSEAEEQQLELQQQGNYLALKTQQQKRHLSSLFQSRPSSLNADDSHFSALVDVAILNITITPLMDAEAAAPMTVIQAIETYFAAVTTTVVDRSGVVTAQMGRTILAIFGLVPVPLSPAQQAVEAGREILSAGSEPIPSPTNKPLSKLDISFEAGAMVTSGKSALGLLRASPYQSMGLISPQMPEIIGLTGHIRPRELMIDAQTFSHLTRDQDTFTQSELSFKDSSSMTIYFCRP